MPRTRVVIQSRLNSSRLPGKAMLTIAGMPLIELVARRASRSGHEVVVATSEEQYDERIARHLSSVGIPVVRGSLDDVLGRFVQATADLSPDDRVVRLTGDNPVADADLVDGLLATLDVSDHTYGRVDIDQVPEGLGAEAFSVAALRDADEQATDLYDREHVTPWLRRTLGELLYVPQGCPGDVHAYRATVDTLGDYVRVSTLFDGVHDPVDRPWLDLMTTLASQVDSAGVRVPSVDTRAGRLSRVILSARRFDDGVSARSAERAEHLRALVAMAVDRGVTHVDVGAAEGRSQDILRGVAEPALVRRFGIISRVAPVSVDSDDSHVHDLAVEASVERTFAALGRRGVEILVLRAEHAHPSGWGRASRYVVDGLVGALGLVITDDAGLQWALEHDSVAYVEVEGELMSYDQAALALLAERGCVIAVPASGGPQAPWVTTSVVSDASSEALEAAIGPWVSRQA